MVTALQRRPELLTEQSGTALKRYRLFCDVLKGFGMRRAAAREVLACWIHSGIGAGVYRERSLDCCVSCP